ncbi:MAG: tandem-95 repeat protein [Pirellulaceae bacterium]|nr:tandem-95 repeat protein [Pirellulaceae bacterium]
MTSPRFRRRQIQDTTDRRRRMRRALMETLERRELLAVDLLANVSAHVSSSSVFADGTFTAWSANAAAQASADAGASADQSVSGELQSQLDRLWAGADGGSIAQRPWFDLIQQEYAQWSSDNGLAFSITAGLRAEGEGAALLAEGEGGLTALDVYVAAPDPSYSFNIIATTPGIGFTQYLVEMTSQTWRSAAETTWEQWKHRLSIIVPNSVTSNKSLLVIGGGGHGGTGGFGTGGLSGTELAFATNMAMATGSVVSSLTNVPYQPLQFTGESFTRSEDAIIAKSYRNYLDGGDDEWPALLPMVKSAVRAMDTVQTVAQQQHNVAVTNFVVSGASKRGWTTWLTAAVDPRVTAIAPMVINVLNMDEQMPYHKRAYEGVTAAIVGGYSAAVVDYVNEGIFDRFDDPRGQELLKIVDPYEYLDRLTIPKFMINGTGDEFFVPDSDQFFYHDLLGEKSVRYLPNAGHSLNQDAFTSLGQFYQAQVAGVSLPRYNWNIRPSGPIEVTTQDSPTQVRLWQATNPVSRDFRQAVVGSSVIWTSSILSPTAPGNYVARVDRPMSGYTAFMVELTYNIAGQEVKLTTGVSVISSTDDTPPEGLQLLSVAPNSGIIFNFNRLNVLEQAPTELVLRFNGAVDSTNLNGIQIIGAGKDGAFGTSDDILNLPVWRGEGDSSNVIIVRLASTLDDGLYRVQVSGRGGDALRSLGGQVITTRVFDSTPGDRTLDTVDFRLNLGAKVLGIVPQPVDRLPNGALNPRREIIRVYFNDDDLNPASAQDPAFYQLIFTGDTVEPTDDRVFYPTSVVYDRHSDMAELTFAQPIDSLMPGGGTFRLRVGSRAPVSSTNNPPNVVQFNEFGDVGATVSNAFSLGSLNGSASLQANGTIITTTGAALPLDFPGGNFEPGHRDIQDEIHLAGADSNPQISTISYNFALNRSYGNDAANQPVFTSITPEQKQRVREVFEFYSQQLGIDFIESESAGLTIVVGDMWPNGRQSGPGGVAGVAGGGLAIMDGAETWDNSFGSGFFTVAMHEIGHLLGLIHSYDLPAGTIMGSESELSGPTAFAFPGDHDVTHGLRLHRRDNRDVDTYSFVLPAGQSGRMRIETIAQRLANSSNLDTHLTLFRQTSQGLEVVASNDKSFGSDSYIDVTLPTSNIAVTYFVSVTGSGNQDFNPEVHNTGSGAFSQGQYQLRLSFDSAIEAAATIVDMLGTPLDGDGDGIAGGNFNFWFRAVPPTAGTGEQTPKTIYVDKAYTGSTTNGSAAQPMKNLNFATWPAALRPRSGDIVRVAGSAGGQDVRTVPAYEFGRGGVGNAILQDGLTLQVPQGVALMVDAGAIFKLQGSQVTTGSLSASVDNSLSALQVLGTPNRPVYFTSYKDESLGIDTNPLVTAPAAGDWGGINFKSDVDLAQGRNHWERHGIFLNYVAGAHIRYGGGQVTVLSPSPVVNPIMMHRDRPTILNNLISSNSDAALSADPNSFTQTLFSTPQFQLAATFSSDYDRVGPHIRSNRLSGNSINGIFVRTTTQPGQPLNTLDFTAKFDDTEIVHVIGENLIISGQPGGGFRETSLPNVSLTQTATSTGGSLASGAQVTYKVTFVDRWGNQGLPSAATPATVVGSGGAVQLNGLPAVSGDFVRRQLWRSIGGGAYRLVANLDGATGSYKDIGTILGATLAQPNQSNLVRGRLSARLEVAPGVIVKSSNARIEISMGAQLIAEGTAASPIVFTSRADDRYGAGGVFDTDNDGTLRNPGAGDWGGLLARHLSSLSIDHSLVTFAGGVTSVAGGFTGVNAIEIHQSTARIANSRFETNASGLGGDVGGARDGRGPHDASVIYVVGSQPVIIGNTFRNNSTAGTAVISINSNALNAVNVVDPGRQTGNSLRSPLATSNQGPLVRGNALSNNGVNGMRVRGQILTTESIWDDTDIVHVVQGEVKVPDFHTYGGLTLRSRVDEGLIVKMESGAGFTAMGRPLDITDRIGGAIRILGTPGFPVIITSLADDSVGAGFDAHGAPLRDTNNNGVSSGIPGDWRSIRLEPYANDRNVAMVSELESDQLRDRGANDDVQSAQHVGALAADLRGGDENLRLGFSIDGVIANPGDVDVYSFTGTAGSLVWLDVDRTSGSLDSVVELLNAAGLLLAQSTNSLLESLGTTQRYVIDDPSKILPSQVLGLDADPFAPRNSRVPIAADFHSLNPHDAGMRVILPGTPGQETTYYVRVRSSNVPSGSSPANSPDLQDESKLRDGKTSGTYRLQIRRQQTDEVAGSVIQYADIRYAATGVEAYGMPASSPLLGQLAESVLGVTNLGNIANSDRASITVAGSIGTANEIRSFTFSVGRDSIQVINPEDGTDHISVVFDIDYANGFGRPGTKLWVFNSAGQLVYIGNSSNIADDQSAPARSSDLTDLTRGSGGRRDAYIGPVELPAGDYVVLVTNESQIAAPLLQFYDTSATSLVQVEPLSSIRRISVDRFGGPSGATSSGPLQVSFNPDIDGNRVEWTLADVTAFVVTDSASGLNSILHFANAFTGAKVADVSQFPRVHDVALAPTGQLVGFAVPPPTLATDENAGIFMQIDTVGQLNSSTVPANAFTSPGTSGIETFTTQQSAFFPAPPAFAVQPRDQVADLINNPVGDGIVFEALTFYTNNSDQTLMFAVGSRGNNQSSFNTASVDLLSGNVVGIGPASTFTRNIVYRINPEDGSVINADGRADREGVQRVNGVTGADANAFSHAGTNKIEFGRFVSTGTITGLAEIGGILYAVSNQGELFAATTDGDRSFGSVAAPITVIVDPQFGPVSFTGLTRGPSELHQDMLFGTTANGRVYAFNTAGQFLPVFAGASFRTQTTGPNGLGAAVNGIDFSTLSRNLWHVSDLEADSPGHGRTIPPDNSQPEIISGGDALYFGINNSYDMPGGAHGAILSNPIDLRSYSSDDLPMLYFNYLLDTEGQNSDLNQNERMRDAFRVYGAGEDGQWILLATNNTPADGGANRLGSTDELDNDINLNRDPYGNPIPSQELFDVGEWRQARVSLAALAGKANVRLRFEFSTAGSFATGDPLRGGVEVIVVAGSRIQDGTGFTMTPVQLPGQTPQNFEFEHGLVLSLPGGASLLDGASSVTINGNVLTFSTTSNVGNNIFYLPTDGSATIANRLSSKLVDLSIASLAAITIDPLHPNTLAVANLPAGGAYGVSSMGTGVLRGLPGVTGNAVPIPITPAMTAAAVRDAMRVAFNDTFGNPVMRASFPAESLATWHFHDNILRLYGYRITNNGSAVGVTTQRAGDRFGVDLNNPTSQGDFAHMDERAANNTGRGVFIDDIIIGFAERGEMVFNAPTDLIAFVPNPQYAQTIYETDQIEEGDFQLTIRTAADYGTNDDFFSLLRDFDTNDRLSRSLGIQVRPDAPGRIVDGTTFTLSDTQRSLTFEYDVVLGLGDPAAGVQPGNMPVVISPADSPERIARAIVAAINAAFAQSVLNVTAAVRGQTAGQSDSRIIELHGKVATDLAGGFGFAANTFLDPLRWGNDSGFGEDLGDVERQRPQGQFLIAGSLFTNTANFGVLLSAGDRSQPYGSVGDRPYPGAPINFPTRNVQGLAPGVVVMNSIFANNSGVGLRISGDPETDATVQIARVINNTFHANPVGLLIDGGASPTVLNNIFSNPNVGIGVQAAGGATAVLGANLFKGNSVNTSGVSAGSFNIVLNANDPLFANTLNRQLYLAAGSQAIDASLEALQERAALTQVKSPLGLPLSPMLAPDRDATGQLRVDDPTLNSPSGMGANVFKDRGAVERADFAGPIAVLLQPQDNDAALLDSDRSLTNIRLQQGNLQFFSILLEDLNGIGPDEASVVSANLQLTENGRRLRAGTDYTFGYNANNRTLRLTPRSGIWRNDSVYEITLSNQASSQVVIPDGETVTDGLRLTVTRPQQPAVVFEFDLNGVVSGSNRPVPFTINSSAYEIASQLAGRLGAAGIAYLLTSDGTLTIFGQASSSDSNLLPVTAVGAIQDLAGNALAPNRATGLTQFTIIMPEVELDYGDAGGVNIPTVEAGGGNGARHTILPIDAGRLVLGSWVGAEPDGQPAAAADGDDYGVQVNIGTLGGVAQGTAGPARLTMPAASALNGQFITITAGPTPLEFRFDTTGTATGNASRVIVALAPADSASVVAQKFAAAVYQAQLQARLSDLTPMASGAVVSLGGSSLHQFNLAGAPAISRVARGNVDVVFPISTASLANGQTMSITDNLGRSLVFELNATTAAPGNVLVQVNLATATAAQVAQAFANTIQAQVSVGLLQLGGAFMQDARTLRILGNDEDGVRFGGLFNVGSAPVPVTIISSGAGMLDAWIDWNGDGDFNDADERLFGGSVPVVAGANLLNVATPAHAGAGLTTARFRLSKSGGLLAGGVGVGGEVEDYLIEIAPGSPPVANADTYALNEDGLLQVSLTAAGVLANDTDADVPQNQLVPGGNLFVHDDNPFTPIIDPVIGVANGTLILQRNGTFTYIPRTNFAGTDFFVYRATDGRLVSPVPATVTITVHPVNDAPSFALSSNAVTSREDQGLVTVDNFMTNLRPGPITAVDELGQTVTLVVEALTPSAFTVQPAIDQATGRLTYQTAADVNSDMGLDLQVRIVATDNGPAPGTGGLPHQNQTAATFTVVVEPINDAPLFQLSSTQVNVNEGPGLPTTLTSFVTGVEPGPPAAIDEASQVLQFTTLSVSNPALFTLGGLPQLSPNGTLTFTSAPHRHGTAVVVVQLMDDGPSQPLPNSNVSAPQTFTISVASVNDPPEFTIPATVNVVEDQGPVIVSGFASSIRPGPVEALDEITQTVQFELEPLDASVFATAPSMTPSGNLSFRIADNINSLNAALDGKLLRVLVRLRDSGPSAPPNRNTSDWQTFTINVAPVNDPPVAPDFNTTTDEDTPLVLQATAILAGASGGPTSDESSQVVQITQVPSTSSRGGRITSVVAGSGAAAHIVSITYTPPENYVGTDSFVYIMRDDGVPERLGTASIVITVNGINDPPEFSLGANQLVLEDAPPVTVVGWATNIRPGPSSAVDEIGQTVSFQVTTDQSQLFSAGGQPVLSSDGRLTFQVAPDAVGTAVLRIVAQDNGPSGGNHVHRSPEFTASITILPVNDPPVFTSGGDIAVDEDSPTYSQPWATGIAPAAGLLLNPPRAVDEAAQAVSFVVSVNNPAAFSIQPTVSSTGVLTFKTAQDFNGAAVLTVRAIDSGSGVTPNVNQSEPVTFTITVNPVNDAPVAENDSYSVDENSLLQISAPGLLLNDRDVDLPNDQLSVVAGSLQSLFGATVVLNANGSFTYDPRGVPAIQQLPAGQTIIDTFTYRAVDLAGAQSNLATVTILVRGVNDPPVARDDSTVVGIGGTVAILVLSNDSDPDSLINPASIQITRLPLFGSVTVRSTGIVEYTATAGFQGSDVFGYRVRDMEGSLSNEALVTVATNGAPVAVDDVAQTYRNQAVIIPVLANDSDSDGTLDPASVQIVVPPNAGTAEVLGDGTIRFTPTTGVSGEFVFSYNVADNHGTRSNTAQVAVRILPSRWQNPTNNLDVDASGRVTARDALLIINYLNSDRPRSLAEAGIDPPPFYDVNGDEFVRASDALLVINYLNRSSQGGGSGGEGELAPEGEYVPPSTGTPTQLGAGTDWAMLVTPEQMLQTVGRQIVQRVEQRRIEQALVEHLGEVSQQPGALIRHTTDDVHLQSQRSSANDIRSSGDSGFDESQDSDDVLRLLSRKSTELRSQRNLVDYYFDS